MATASKLTKDYLTCIICYEVYTDPATLQCDHTFCRPCLLKYTKTKPEAIQARSIPCPICMQMTQVTSPDKAVEEWIKQVKPSRIMQGLVENFGQGKQVIDHCNVCNNRGDTTRATTWCPDCEASFCDNCALYHRLMPNSRDHDVKSFTGDVKFKPSKRFTCRIHDDEQVKLFCRDCKKAICHTCCSISHRTCKTVVTIKEVLPDITNSLWSRKQSLDEQIKLKSNKITEQSSRIKTILEDMNKVEAEIKMMSDKAVGFIRDKEKKLMKELDGITQSKVSDLKAEMKIHEMSRQVHQQQSEFIDQAVTSESQRAMFDMYERCNFDLGTDTTEEENTGNKNPKTTGFVWDVRSLKKSFDGMQLGRLYEVKGREVGHHSCPVLVKRINTRTNEETNEPSITDIAIVKVNETKVLIVTDENNNSVKTFYTEGDRLRQSVLRLGAKPFGVTAVGDNEVYVTSPSSKEMYKVLVYPQAKCISKIATGRRYCGIRHFNQSLLAVPLVSIFKWQSIDIIDFQGNILKSITARDTSNPRFVHAAENGTILVSDRATLIVFTGDGKVSHTYRPTGDRALVQPRGIATTITGDILLADWNANKVIQLTPSGDFIRDILTDKDDLKKPHGLHLDDDGLLYVSCGNDVKVYTFT